MLRYSRFFRDLPQPADVSASDNFTQQILCEVGKGQVGKGPAMLSSLKKILEKKSPLFHPFIRSQFTRAVSVAVLGIVLLIWPKAPLRLIIDRQLDSEIHRSSVTVILTDSLECGHTVFAFVDFRDLLNAYTEDPAMRARRHRCRECQALAIAKKPVRSVAIADVAVAS